MNIVAMGAGVGALNVLTGAGVAMGAAVTMGIGAGEVCANASVDAATTPAAASARVRIFFIVVLLYRCSLW